MPEYSYIAKTFEGQTQTGRLNVADEHSLASILKSQNLMLISAKDASLRKKHWWNFEINIFGVSSADKIMVTRNLGVMFSSGMPLTKSFEILASQAKNKTLKAALVDIHERVSRGENFSDALAFYPRIFSELFCNMVKVGEESGTLDEVFNLLSSQLTKEHELASKIKNALIYPCIIVFVMMVAGALIVTVVLPALKVFFASLNIEVPIYTQALFVLGDFLTNRWYFALAMFIAFLALCWMAIKSHPGRMIIDTVVLRIPMLSGVVKKSNSAGLIRSISSLVVAGVSLTRALEITAKTVGNHYFKEALLVARDQVQKGEKLSTALRPYQSIFPLGVVEMIEVGEETGQTSAILKKLADFYEQEAIAGVEKMTTIIEPAMIIILGLCVAFFAISIIQPMYTSLQSINGS